MATNPIGVYRGIGYTLEFHGQGENVFAKHFVRLQLENTYSIDRFAVEALSPADVLKPLHEIVIRLLNQEYTPSIQRGNLVWSLPPHLKGERLLLSAEQLSKEANYSEAVSALVEAQAEASFVSDPFGEANFLEKLDREWVQELVEKTHDPRIEFLLLQKDAVRRAFETALQKLSAASPQEKKPTCFICFSIEKELGRWLEHTFVPDLDRVGVAPLFCFRQLGPGKELNRFQQLIRFSDLVVVMCTHDLKKKCVERESAPVGVAQEIRLAQERYNDIGKNETIYPFYLQGDRGAVCPSPFFEPILGTNLTLFDNNCSSAFYSYYSVIFETFGNMRNVPRPFSREVKELFLKEATKILKEKIFDKEAVEQWRVERIQQKKTVEVLVNQAIEAALGTPLIQRDRIQLDMTHPNFVGRKDLLDRLETDFQFSDWKPTNPTQIRLLCGPGGIGKTELGVTFANNFLSQFSLVWVIRAESAQLFEEDYRSLAHALNLYLEDDNLSNVKIKVHKALERGIDGCVLPWLLILDNAEEKIEIPQRGGYVLVTTQYPEIWIAPNAVVPVTPFSIHDANLLFQRLEYPLCIDDLELLVKELEGFPVLLEQVGHFLRRTHCPVREYLAQIHSYDEIIWKDPVHRYPKILGKVIQKSLEVLQGRNVHAFAFLQFCAYLNPDNISPRLLDFFALQYNLSSQQKRNLIGALNDAFLMRYSAATQSFSLHRLVQSVIQHLQNQYCSAVSLLVLWSKQFDWHKVETWPIGEECTRHLEKIQKNPHWATLNPKLKVDLLFVSGVWYSRVKYDYQAGLELLQQAYDIGQGVYPEQCREIAHILSEMGCCIWKIGDIRAAHHYFKKSLKMREKVLGLIHEETAASVNNLALTTSKGVQKKLYYARKALEIWEKVYEGNVHPNLGLAYNNMGTFLSSIGRKEESMVMYSRALLIFQNYYKRPDPTIAMCYQNKAVSLSRSSPLEALALLRESKNIYKAVYGRTHPSVANIYCMIGKRHFGQPELAVRQLDKALSIYQALEGQNSSNVARICIEKGNIFHELEDYEQALVMRQRGLKIWQEIHVVDHYNLSWGHHDVARSLNSLGRFAESLFHFKEALRILLFTRGDAHELTVIVRSNIGAIYESLGNHAEALSHFKDAFKAAACTQHSLTSKFFGYTLESLQRQTDHQLAVLTATELLEFCNIHLGETNEFSPQILALQRQSSASGYCSIL